MPPQNRVRFVCNREGNSHKKEIIPGRATRDRASSRCQCRAHIQLSVLKDQDLPDLVEWEVQSFEEEHNHPTLSAEETALLAAHRKLSDVNEARLRTYKQAGLSVRDMMNLLAVEHGKPINELPFVERDVWNFLYREPGGTFAMVGFSLTMPCWKDDDLCASLFIHRKAAMPQSLSVSWNALKPRTQGSSSITCLKSTASSTLYGLPPPAARTTTRSAMCSCWTQHTK